MNIQSVYNDIKLNVCDVIGGIVKKLVKSIYKRCKLRYILYKCTYKMKEM